MKPQTPWRKGLIVYLVFIALLAGTLAMVARHARAQIVVNGPAPERLFTVAEVNAALAAQAQLHQQQHERAVNEIVIAAREYIQRELRTGCQGQT